MSFTSDVFKVVNVDRFTKFCDTVHVDYELIGPDGALVFSNNLVEPPSSFVHNGVEHNMDFDAELHKLVQPGQRVTYRVEYEVEIHPTGEVEYYCDEMIGMPDKGDSDGKAIANTGRVWDEVSSRTS
jgi:hypothetical protein